jgi:hypothetical protein
MRSPETEAAAERARKLLSDFFSPPNLLQLNPGECPQQLAYIMECLQAGLRRFANGQVDHPLLLPVQFEGDPCTVWYACAETDAQLRALEAELQAFIGPTYAWFRLPEDGMFGTDGHAQPLLGRGGLRHFVMWTQGSQQAARLLEKWSMYSDLLVRRPALINRIPASFDALRADFDRALLARDEGAARLALGAMRDRFGISSENRLYMEIRLFAGLEQWEQIAGHSLLSTLTKLNLPQETYGDILEGMYMAHVFPFEQGAPLPAVLEEFKVSVLDRGFPLFRTRRQSRRPAVLKSFVLFELLQSAPQLDVLNHLLSLLPANAWGPLEPQVLEAVTGLQPPEDLASPAWRAYEYEQFDRAYGLLLPLPDSVDVLRALIRCVDEAKDPARAEVVIQRMQRIPETVRTHVEEFCQKTWPRVQQLARLALNNQLSWVERMAWNNNLGESLEDYVDRWREWARAPNVDELLDEEDFGTRAADLLEYMALEHSLAFNRIAPLWHEVFIVNADPDPRLKPVYHTLLETLRLTEAFGDVELRMVRDNLNHLARASLTGKEYAKTLEDIGKVFETVRSPYYMHWALDVCDLLASAPCPDPASRLRLLSAVGQAGQEFAARMGPADLAMLSMLAQESGIDLTLPTTRPASGESKRSATEVGTVGIYSLDEAASHRAAKVLHSLYPGLDVRVNSDVVCTPQLRSLAQRAEIFVFAWKTSKHAAYYCIKAASRSENSLEMAQGAGASSMIGAVVQSLSRKNGA